MWSAVAGECLWVGRQRLDDAHVEHPHGEAALPNVDGWERSHHRWRWQRQHGRNDAHGGGDAQVAPRRRVGAC